MSKTKNIEELKNIVDKLKGQNKKIITTNGVFDILHIGHIRYLQEAKKFGDILIIAVNSDSSTKQIKGTKRPLNNEDDRMEALAALQCVDYVVIFDQEDPKKILEEIRPDIHVKGGDYDPKNFKQMPEAEIINKYGGEVKIVSLFNRKSTTNVINKIRK